MKKIENKDKICELLNKINSSATQLTKCPICCETECTYPHNMKTHIIGAHIKNGDFEFDNVISKVDDKIKSDTKNVDFWKNLLERLNNYEPEFTADDEKNCRTDLKIKGGFNLNSYFEIKNLICREERQYAHFLASKLEQEKGKEPPFLKKLGINGKLIEVYFECTFMRDYWNANKITYNEKLKAFVEKDPSIKGKIDIGKKRANHPNYWEKSHPYARWMTNAKPDIGLLVKNGKKYELHFLECKYISGEDKYKADGVEGKLQTEVQDMILEFLCTPNEEKGLGLNYKGQTIVAGKVKLVRFTKKGESAKEKEIQIEISKLLSCKSC